MIYDRVGIKRLPLTMVLLVQVCFFVSAAVTDLSVKTADDIRKNKYIDESLRLQNLARQSFAGGDYDMAERYAEEAVQAATDSDAYIARINTYTTSVKMKNAREKLALADSVEIKRRHPVEFYDAKTYYNLGLIAESARQWKTAINNADKVIKTLAAITMPVSMPETHAVVDVPVEKLSDSLVVTTVPVEQIPETSVAEVPAENVQKDSEREQTPLPARYVVRAWEVSRDCLWNIAGRSWVYGNPYRWPILYRANKEKLPDPNNPDIVEPGTIIDIPSLNGEKRSGFWDSGKTYSPLRK
jgi:tetratricopeptide (TPR) repeat protein